MKTLSELSFGQHENYAELGAESKEPEDAAPAPEGDKAAH
jgi:hypothetical protein